MLTITIEYTDFDGEKQSEDFFFNLKRSELIELDSSIPGGLASFSKRITNERDIKALMDLFKGLILKAYGVRSDDKKKFRKREEETADFYDSAAYDELYMWLLSDVDHASEFFNSLVPSVNSDSPKADAHIAIKTKDEG